MASLKQRHAHLVATSTPYAVLADMVQSFQKYEPSLLARQSAYSLLYAVPSVLIMLLSLAAIVDQNTGSSVSGPLREFISEEAPKDLQPLLDGLVEYALVETSQNTALVAALVALLRYFGPLGGWLCMAWIAAISVLMIVGRFGRPAPPLRADGQRGDGAEDGERGG